MSPDQLSREAYLRQQLIEVHEVIDGIIASNANARDTANLYTKAHKLRDALDAELDKLAAAAANDADESMSAEEFLDALTASLLELPADLREQVRERVWGGLRIVHGG